MAVLDALMSFVERYYIAPIYEHSLGYNFINSITYAFLGFLGLYLIYVALIKQYKIRADLRFVMGALPFVVLGSFIRALVDHRIIAYGFWTVTPGIYLMLISFFVIALVLGVYIDKKFGFPYWKVMSLIGVVPILVIAFKYSRFIDFHRGFAAVLIPALVLAIAAGIHFAAKHFKWDWVYFKRARLAFLAIVTHSLDACSTFVFHDFYGGGEQHPIPRAVIEYTGTGLSFVALKIAVVLAVLYLLRREIKEKNLRNFFIAVILLLGLAQGLRNYLTIILT